MISSSPNDTTAKYYDIVQRPLKGAEITLEELKLITKLAPGGGKILDVGCGTGRHIGRLVDLGYEVNGIDISDGMIAVLKEKFPSVKTHIGDFLTHDFKCEQFDLVILMWNTFNEIALSDEQAKETFEQFRKIIKDNGRILINIDDSTTFEPKDLKFETVYSKNGLDYKQDWKAVKYDLKTNTTESLEKITVTDENGKIVDELETVIVQRWWAKDQVQSFANDFGFKIENVQIGLNRELYLILMKV